jgi:uncharacterized protein (DUF427 family)
MVDDEGAQLMSEHDVRVEPSPKRVRAFFGGVPVFDTTRARLVWEVPYYPQYYVPGSDVRADLVPTGRTKTSRSRGVGHLHTVRVGGAEAVEAATTYDESPVEALRGLVRFKFGELDAWFEEDEQIYTHPRSPYTRVDILPTSRHVVVEAGGVRIAESTRASVLFETGLPPRYYLPQPDVRLDLLRASDHVTHCPYKGRAVHWSVNAGTEVLADAAWSYPMPLPESIRIAGLVSFYPSKVDVIVDDVMLPAR